MDIDVVEKIATSQSIWSIVALILLYVIGMSVKHYIKHQNQKFDELREESKHREDKVIELYEKQRIESLERENRLMEHLNKTTETLGKIDHSLFNLQYKVDETQKKVDKVDRGLKEVWEHLKGK